MPDLKPRCLFAAWLLSLTVAATQANGQANVAEKATAKYSEDVVAKADKIFADAGVKRSGKTLQAIAAADINRAIANLSKSRRSIKLLSDARKQSEDQLAWIGDQFRLTDAQTGELNLRMAQVAGDVVASNQLIGLINANTSKLRQFDDQRNKLREKLASERKTLSDVEAVYAESVLTIRRDLNALQARLEEALKDSAIKVALTVYNVNYQTPPTLDIADLIGPIDRRLKQIEKEVFLESIQMEVTPSGSLYVNVLVGEKSMPMVLDSGASLIVLPAETAVKLGVVIPPSAPAMRLVLADGRAINASGVVLPKVRLGAFEAENVEAAVLEPNAIHAEPLLGMSFLGNFKFEIDAAGRTLKLLRVGEPVGE